MFNDQIYNLFAQITEEHKSLWRIKKYYLKDAEGSEDQVFWQRLAQDKENHIQDLEALIKKRLS